MCVLYRPPFIIFDDDYGGVYVLFIFRRSAARVPRSIVDEIFDITRFVLNKLNHTRPQDDFLFYRIFFFFAEFAFYGILLLLMLLQ